MSATASTRRSDGIVDEVVSPHPAETQQKMGANRNTTRDRCVLVLQSGFSVANGNAFDGMPERQ